MLLLVAAAMLALPWSAQAAEEPHMATGTADASEGFVKVHAGDYHTMGIKADGTVWAWGDNMSGQLGLGDNMDRSTPTEVVALSGARHIALGRFHSMAIKADGTVWTWGNNTWGQLGLGDTTARSTPTQITTLTGARQLELGGAHSMAIKADGTVWSWGLNADGQLGLGNLTSYSVPTQVTALTGARQLALGMHHSMAIHADGTVWAWGYNAHGQLGLGDTTTRSAPTQVTAPTGTRQLAVGDYHSTAIRADGTVWTWGDNYYGQLGLGDTTNRFTPTQVTSLTGVRQLEAGGSHSMALADNGTVWSWGFNAEGELGHGDTTNRSAPAEVTALAGSRRLELGGSHSLSVRPDGSVHAWGNNSYGELGVGDTTDRNSPTLSLFECGCGFVDVQAGAAHSMGIKADGTVWAWGNNKFGQLGLGDTVGRTTATQVLGLIGARQLALGAGHSMAIMGDGTVWAWGSNAAGQLGLGDTTTRTIPTQVTALTGARQLVLGGHHSMAIMGDGSVLAWGKNAAGQLGLGDTMDRSSPTQVTALTGARQLMLGGHHSMAIMGDGTVWAWGNNAAGQLGLGDTTTRTIPTQITALTGVRQLVLGDDHSMAIQADGTVGAWGDNAFGQLGLGDTTARSSPTQVTALTGARQLAGNGSHSAAIRADGTVWTWGVNDDGQLGLGDILSRSAPTQVAGLTGARHLALGAHHSMAITADGTTWTSGRNGSGQLGLGDTAARTTHDQIFLCDAAPAEPASLEQFESDGTTSIPTATWTNQSTVVMKFSVSDPNPGQTLTPWVEVRTDTAWSGICGGTGSTNLYAGPAVSTTTASAAVQATVTVSGLVHADTYYWRACVVDQSGLASLWTPRGGAPDFRLDLTPPQSITTLTAPSPTTSSPELGWSIVSDAGSGVAFHRVYRSASATGPWTLVSSDGVVTGTTFTDTGALVNAEWHYVVRAVDAVGNEAAASNVVSVFYHRPPDQPTLLSPAADATAVDLAAQLTGTYSDPDSDAGSLAFEVCTDSACGAVALSGSSPSVASGSDASYTTPSLDPATTYWLRARAIDSRGATSSWSSIQSFTTIGPPSITVNQIGDDTWRSTNSGTYDVDFADASALASFDTEVWSSTGQTGTQLQAWTTVAALSGISYTVDWALDASTWTAIPDGTSYVTVRVSNTNGLDTIATDAFYVRKDTTAPTAITSLAAASPTIYAPALSWESAPDATSGTAFYRIYRATSSTGPWTEQGTTTALTFTDSSAVVGQTHWYVVRGVDVAGNEAVDSNAVSVYYHRAPAAPGLVAPVDSATGVSSTPTLEATYLDADGDTGTINFQVCADSGCAVVAETVDSAAGVASGTNATAVVSTSLAQGTQYWWRAAATDSTGTQGPWSTTWSFTTSNGPAITDWQDGDATWRSSNVATYDVDFSDPLGLDRFEASVWTGPANSGVLLQDWIVIQDMIVGSSYTTDWGLAASTWGVLAEGINHVSVRAWNASGYSSTLVDAFEVRKDTVATAPPAVSDGPGADITWLASTSELAINWTDATSEAGASGVRDYEYCIATMPGCAGTIARSWTSAGTSTSTVATGLSLVDATHYVAAVRMLDHAGNTSSATSSDGVTVDVSVPSGSVSSSPASPWSGTIRVTGTAADTGSGVAQIVVSYAGTESGAMIDFECANATVTTWADADPLSAGCDWDTTTVADGPYVVSVTITDVAGNASTWDGPTVTVDNNAPVITDVRFVEGTGATFQHAVNCTRPCTPSLWYSPSESGTVELVVAGTDAGVGVASAGWPDVDGPSGGWSPGAGTTTGTSPFTRTYEWTSGATSSSPLFVQLTDFAGNSTTAPIEVKADASVPSGGTITSTTGEAVAATVVFDVGTDSGSQVATHRLERRTTARSGVDGCDTGGWSSWVQAAAAGTASPWIDPAPVRASCHEYRLLVLDGVGNSATYVSQDIFLSAAPGIIFSATNGSTEVVEAGSGDAYAVALRAAPTSDVVVTTSGDGQASASPAQLTFTTANWSTPQTVTVAAVDDPVDETPDEQPATILHSSSSSDAGYQVVTNTLALVVTDNDVAGFEVAAAETPTVSEGSTATESVRVRLTSQPRADVAIAVVGDEQLRASESSLAFTARNWSAWQAVTIAAVDDTIAERTPHSGRMRFAPTSSDAVYAGLKSQLLPVTVRDDDPARLMTRAGEGWTLAETGHLGLAETGEPPARLIVQAVGDPSRDIVITPVVSSTDLAVSPASVRIAAGSHLQRTEFAFHAVDDGVPETTPHAAQISWRVVTDDPLYDTATIPTIEVEIADGEEVVVQPVPADPSPATPAPVSDGGQPPGTTVGDGRTTPREVEPKGNTDRSTSRAPRRTVSRRVQDWAKKHPVAAGAAASVGGSALLAAKPLMLAGKGLAGGGLNMPNGLDELRRLLRGKRRTRWWHRFLIGKRRRRRGTDSEASSDDDHDDDDDWWWLDEQGRAA